MMHQLFAVIIGFMLSSVSAFAQQAPTNETTPTGTAVAALQLP